MLFVATIVCVQTTFVVVPSDCNTIRFWYVIFLSFLAIVFLAEWFVIFFVVPAKGEFEIIVFIRV